ncbi:MAG: DNA adenine methylase, partial [Thermosynechococcaceae cyanobacterium]
MTLFCPPESALWKPKITRSAFRYFGGKWLLGGWIRSHFPQHACYVEPFGGAFSVGLQKQQVGSEIYSDLNADTVNFFQVLQQESERLIDAISTSPRTEAEFQHCQESCDHPVERARRYYLYCQMAYIGGGGRWSHGLSS